MRRRKQQAEQAEPAEAICVETHRPWAIANYIERGTRLPVGHPAVKANPRFFMGLIPLRLSDQ